MVSSFFIETLRTAQQSLLPQHLDVALAQFYLDLVPVQEVVQV